MESKVARRGITSECTRLRYPNGRKPEAIDWVHHCIVDEMIKILSQQSCQKGFYHSSTRANDRGRFALKSTREQVKTSTSQQQAYLYRLVHVGLVLAQHRYDIRMALLSRDVQSGPHGLGPPEHPNTQTPKVRTPKHPNTRQGITPVARHYHARKSKV